MFSRFENETEEEERLSRFGLRLKLKSFLRFLAWSGMVIAALVALCSGVAIIYGIIQSQSTRDYYDYHYLIFSVVLGSLGLTITVPWFFLNLQFMRRGYKTPDLKIILYFSAIVELLVSIAIALIMSYGGILAMFGNRTPELGIFTVAIAWLITGAQLIFCGLKIYAARAMKRKILIACLIFNVFNFIILPAIVILSAMTIFGGFGWVWMEPLVSWFFFFCFSLSVNGYTIALESIILNNQEKMGQVKLSDLKPFDQETSSMESPLIK